MKSLKIIIVFIFICSLMFLCSCSKQEEDNKDKVDYSLAELKQFAIDSIHAYEDKNGTLAINMAEDITLVDTNKDVKGTKITWKSSNSSLINDSGKIVKRPESDTSVEFTCEVEFDGQKEAISFENRFYRKEIDSNKEVLAN